MTESSEFGIGDITDVDNEADQVSRLVWVGEEIEPIDITLSHRHDRALSAMPRTPRLRPCPAKAVPQTVSKSLRQSLIGCPRSRLLSFQPTK